MLAPPQALPFADDQEMGEAWHAVAGYPPAVPTEQEMDSLLVNNEMFALRCAASPDSFFFGPTRELLRTSACRLRVRRNVARLRRCAHCTGRIACTLLVGTSVQESGCMLLVVWDLLSPKPSSRAFLDAPLIPAPWL